MSTLDVELLDSAQEALQHLDVQEYDAIVSDIKMPGMDGFALLAHVQARHPDTPVILITGQSDHQLALRALRGGAYDYIPKPIDRDDFLAALQRAVHTHQLRRQIEAQQRALERYALSLEHLVEQRTRELETAKRAKETLLGLLAQERHVPLTSLNDLLQEDDRDLLHVEQREEILGDLAHVKRPI
jgi:two-component system sensor histidine kinase/response regulator